MSIVIISKLGTILREASYTHPIYPEKTCPVLPAPHVTSESGTGLVHTAPAHGPEDYDVARKHNIQIVMVVSSIYCVCINLLMLGMWSR